MPLYVVYMLSLPRACVVRSVTSIRGHHRGRAGKEQNLTKMRTSSQQLFAVFASVFPDNERKQNRDNFLKVPLAGISIGMYVPWFVLPIHRWVPP